MTQKVKFISTTLLKYRALPVKSATTLYFLEDVGRIYKGSADVTSSVVTVTSFSPEVTDGVEGKLYVSYDTFEVRMIVGGNWITINPGYVTDPSDITDDNASKVATISAIKPYIDTAVREAELSWRDIEE